MNYLLLFFISILIILYYFYNNNNNNFQNARYYHQNNNGKFALTYYKKSLINDNNFLVLIDIGDIYHFGLNDTNIDLNKANLYYKLCLSIIDNLSKKNYLNTKNKFKLKKYKKVIQYRLEQLNCNYNQNNLIDTNVDHYLLNSILDGFDKKSLFKNQEINKKLTIEPILIEEPIIENNYINILNDPQNVHDTHINKTIQSSINKLKKNTPINLNFDQSKQLILQNNNNKNIIKVLDRIENSTIKSYYNNMKLKDLFILVVNHINNYDTEKKNNAIHNLTNELNDCIENNNIVCFIGIMNRIINSLNIIDENVIIKSREVLHQEMMNKCVKIRKELEKNNKNIDDNIFKIEIKKELKKDYVDNKILTQDELDDMINTWIDFI